MKTFPLNMTMKLLNGEMFPILQNFNGTDGRCRITGPIGRLQMMLLDKVHQFNPLLRCIIQVFDEIGTYNEVTGNYSGAIGQVLAGDADVVAYPSIYPLKKADVHPSVYTWPILEDTMTILSFYNETNGDGGEQQDITFMFSTVPWLLWFLMFLSYVTFICVYKLGCHCMEKGKKCNSVWITTCAFLNEDNFPDSYLFISSLSVVMATGVFFAMTFLGSLTTTDLVIVESPVVVKTYQDIIDRNIKVSYVPTYDEQMHHINSPKDSIYSKVYKNKNLVKATQRDLNNTRMYFTQEQVSIARHRSAEAAGYMVMLIHTEDGTRFMDAIPNARGLLVRDPEWAFKFTSVLITHHRGGIFERYEQYIKLSTMKMVEAGFYQKCMDDIPTAAMEIMFSVETANSLSQKFSAKVEEGQSDPVSVKMVNIKTFIKLFLGMIINATAALIFEFFLFKVKKLIAKRNIRKVFITVRTTTLVNQTKIAAKVESEKLKAPTPEINQKSKTEKRETRVEVENVSTQTSPVVEPKKVVRKYLATKQTPKTESRTKLIRTSKQ